MTIDSADDSKISNRTIDTNRISNRTYYSKSNRITKLRRSLGKTGLKWPEFASSIYESSGIFVRNPDKVSCRSWTMCVVLLTTRTPWISNKLEIIMPPFTWSRPEPACSVGIAADVSLSYLCYGTFWHSCRRQTICVVSDDMEVVSDSEEAANYHQILEFFEMCANLITTLARWSTLALLGLVGGGITQLPQAARQHWMLVTRPDYCVQSSR